MRWSTVLLALVLAWWAVLIPAVAAPSAAAPVCHLSDPRIGEASGIAAGIASPGVVYVNNDSGDTARFFALDARTCGTVATITVRGARNVDWEDLAVARDAAGTPSVWLGDIGDNDAARSHVTVYRVAEPRLDGGRSRIVSVAQSWRLRYPDGPTDAESLAVAPGGAAYIVTKSLSGASVVYRVPMLPSGGVQRLERVADLALTPVGTSPFGVVGTLLATGAAFSRDGTRFVVRTYSSAFVWTVRDGDLAAALRTQPATLVLPSQPQGEGVAIVGSRLLLDSEGAGSAVLSTALPAAATSASPSASADSSATASSSSANPPKKAKYGNAGSWIPGLVILGLVIIGSILWWSGQLSRPARGPDR